MMGVGKSPRGGSRNCTLALEGPKASEKVGMVKRYYHPAGSAV